MMNPATSSASGTSRDQARFWFARLRADDCTAQERRAFDTWIAAAPEHAEAYARVQRFWNDLNALAPQPKMSEWRAEAARSTTPTNFRFPMTWRRGALLAAGAAACLALGVRLAPRNAATPDTPEYTTQAGEQRELVLADGSHLKLNTDTSIRVRIDVQKRDVELVRGEVLFDVTHEAERPFHVRMGAITVTDLGTSFNIHRSAEDTQVTLISGRAEVTRDGGAGAVELVPGDQLISAANVWRKLSVTNLAAVTDWSSGHLIFRATPLADVVARVNRYGPGRLVIADAQLASMEVSGDFRIGNTDALVRALQSAFPVRAETSPDGETKLYARR